MLDLLVRFVTSLKLTVVALALAIILVFVGTLAQVHQGLYAVQERYFQSFFVWWGPPGASWQLPVFPGGYLIGGAMLLSLLATFFRQFRLGQRKVGLIVVHFGLILLLAGQLLTDGLAKESAMRFVEGETRNYSEAFRELELVVIDSTGPDSDLVVTLPVERLASREEIRLPGVPVTLHVKKHWPNAGLLREAAPGAVDSGATQGSGVGLLVLPKPSVGRTEDGGAPAALVELRAGQVSLGNWLLFPRLPQSFVHDRKTYGIDIRATRFYTPFSLTLLKTTHEVYPGTDIPKNFQSRVRIDHPAKREVREVDIYMNNPLRYGGLTFYQYQMGRDEVDANRGTSVLQVVRNPGWLTPYIGCVLVGAGLAVQFLAHLAGFVRERRAA
jgi:hypothetical protein